MANIRTARRSGLVLRGGRQRRESLWLFDTALSTAVATGTAVLLKSLNAAALALRPFTIVRTRGVFFLSGDNLANTENWMANFGHIIVSDEAIAVGVTAIPTPVTEPSSDWHVIETLAGRLGVSSAIGLLEQGKMATIDSKAMRKVDLGEDLAIVVETNATGISEGVVTRDFTRILIKLH